MMRVFTVCIPVLVLAASASATSVVIERDLTRASARGVASWSDRGVEVVTPEDALRLALPGEALAVTAGEMGGVAPAAGAGWVDLVDGQRLVGSPSGTPSDGESVGWEMESFGEVWAPLERVRRVVMPRSDADAASEAGRDGGWASRVDPLSDAVLLTNGDVLSGFVLSVEEEVAVERGDGSVSRAPLERCRRSVWRIRSRRPRGCSCGWRTGRS